MDCSLKIHDFAVSTVGERIGDDEPIEDRQNRGIASHVRSQSRAGRRRFAKRKGVNIEALKRGYSMPSLDEPIIKALTDRLKAYLAAHGLDYDPTFLNAGASAAVFRVDTPGGVRAYKVFDPRFLAGDGGVAERKRLRLQEALIGHACEHLIEIYSVSEAEQTAFIEMEFCPWPRLSDSLPGIPDEEVPSLISQLIEVVQYLEDLGIVHRDIKPDNIHISPDFKNLKVLDLGVARVLDSGEGEFTDRNHLRPFVATAQYSSPEYLFAWMSPRRGFGRH